MIEAAEMVVAALSAGAAAGLTNTATTAVADAHKALKNAARRVLRRGNADKDAVEKALEAPDGHRDALVKALVDAGVESETELIEAAEKVRSLLGDSTGAKFSVKVRDSTGVQIGDNPVMHLKVEK